MSTSEAVSEIHEIVCSNCGATLTYAPGSNHLKCTYCGTENEIEAEVPGTVEEIDYHQYLSGRVRDNEQLEEVHAVTCGSCGAATTLNPNVASDLCPFCATPLVVQQEQTAAKIRPKYMLPFSIERGDAHRFFEQWIAKRWFAPRDLKRYATDRDRIQGLYIPYWTYDANTQSVYTGERGTNHTERYTTVENGKRVSRTRTVIRWRRVRGSVSRLFDDVLVIASKSLPEKYAARLEPWDLENLSVYDGSYCAGFRTETYQVGLEEGFDNAKKIMDTAIRSAIKRDIGGDHQRISSVNTTYNDITFKHILLPVWLSAYRYKSKVYRFMVNGRTGEVQGERPWSIVKITLAATGAAAAIAAAWYFLHPYFQ